LRSRDRRVRSITGSEADCFYLKRSAAELKQIAQDWCAVTRLADQISINLSFFARATHDRSYAGNRQNTTPVMRALQVR